MLLLAIGWAEFLVVPVVHSIYNEYFAEALFVGLLLLWCWKEGNDTHVGNDIMLFYVCCMVSGWELERRVSDSAIFRSIVNAWDTWDADVEITLVSGSLF